MTWFLLELIVLTAVGTSFEARAGPGSGRGGAECDSRNAVEKIRQNVLWRHGVYLRLDEPAATRAAGDRARQELLRAMAATTSVGYVKLIRGRSDAVTLQRHFEAGIQQIWLPNMELPTAARLVTRASKEASSRM